MISLTILLLGFSSLMKSIHGGSQICKVLDEYPANTILYENETGLKCKILVSDHLKSIKQRDSGYIEITLTNISNPFAKYFKVDSDSLTVLTNDQKIDREEMCNGDKSLEITQTQCCRSNSNECLLKFMAKISVFSSDNSQLFNEFSTFYMVLADVNDNEPKFNKQALNLEISENSKVGSKFLLPMATDLDSSDYNIKGYRLVSEKSLDFFKLTTFNEDGEDGVANLEYNQRDANDNFKLSSDNKQIYLKLIRPVDRETKENHTLRLIAEDKGSPTLSGSIDIFIKVKDENDNFPVFKDHLLVLNISEGVNIGHRVVQVEAVDPDEGRGGSVVYSFSPETIAKRVPFMIYQRTGHLTVIQKLDYESEKYYELRIIAKDLIGNSGYDEALIKINIEDVNDEPPVIQIDTNTNPKGGIQKLSNDGNMNTFKWQVKEDALLSSQRPLSLAIIGVSDRDTGLGGKVVCKLKNDTAAQESPDSIFLLNLIVDDTFELLLRGPIDYEERSVEKVKIICNDFGNPSLSSYQNIEVFIKDINDNTPEFEKANYFFTVKENDTFNGIVGKVSAKDKDSDLNGRLNYQLDEYESEVFSIGPNNGLISVKRPLDWELRKDYQFKVYAIDQGSEIKMTATTTVEVKVLDINDNKPEFVGMREDDVFHFRVHENETPGTQIGAVIANDLDGDENNEISYRLIAVSVPFKIDEKTGIITTTKEIDREKKSSFELTVVAQDNGQPKMTSSAKVFVEILDVNDNSPTIIFPAQNNTEISISYKEPINELIGKIEARDQDENSNSQLHFTMNNEDLQIFYIDEYTGELRVAREMTFDDIGLHKLSIVVQDSGIPPRSSVVDLLVKINDSIPRAKILLVDNKTGSRADFQESGLITPGNMLIIIVGLICIVILVLLALTMYLCRKRSLTTQLEELEKRQVYRGLSCEYLEQPNRVTPVMYTSLDCHQKTSQSDEFDLQSSGQRRIIDNLESSYPNDASMEFESISERRKVCFSLNKNPDNLTKFNNGNNVDNSYTALKDFKNVSTNMIQAPLIPQGNNMLNENVANDGTSKRRFDKDNISSQNRYYILYPNHTLTEGKTSFKNDFNTSTEGFV